MLRFGVALLLALPLAIVALSLPLAGSSTASVAQDTPGEGWSNNNFSVIEGVPIRRVEFWGNVTTADRVVRRALSMNEEEVFKAGMVAHGVKRLNKLGRFEKVTEGDVYWQLGEGRQFVDFIVVLKEKPRR